MNDEALWNYGVLAAVAIGGLVLVIRYFRRGIGGKGGQGCGCCSGSCGSKDTAADH
ncbi:MAG: hypothetical protein FD153_1160 [Rhodospirillaceae bacterium]|nr:MAG: hypothetical protein FD153_1160 [Rhodospirillaceae bacterium]